MLANPKLEKIVKDLRPISPVSTDFLRELAERAYALGRSEQRELDAKICERKATEYREAFNPDAFPFEYKFYCYAASGCESVAAAIRQADLGEKD